MKPLAILILVILTGCGGGGDDEDDGYKPGPCQIVGQEYVCV